MYQFDQRPNTVFSEQAQQLLEEIRQSSYSVLCGRNNCGKSFILKTLTQTIGQRASYLGPARYQNFNVLSYFTPNRNRRNEVWNNFIMQWQNQQQNLDNSPLNLQQAIAELNDHKRDQLLEIMEKLLGSKMELKYTVPENSMSQKYISVDGHNISFTSSGYRLISTLVTSLLDEEADTFLIDEPELGVSPEAQGVFSDFIFDENVRSKYFSHIKTLILATHSTIFLDRKNILNNYFIEKNNNHIDISRVSSVADINKIHFFLLGNRLEALYMPSAVIIVEGKCDHKFIERVLSTRYEGFKFSVIQANGDGRIREVFNIAKTLFGDIQKSPYKERIFAVVDSVHGQGLVQHLQKMGVSQENIVVWTKNGIEYYYPDSVIKNIFHSDNELIINGDRIRLNGLEYTKNDLADMVVSKIDKNTEYNQEFLNEFLSKIEVAIGLTIQMQRTDKNT